jgi:hypothetical protein
MVGGRSKFTAPRLRMCVSTFKLKKPRVYCGLHVREYVFAGAKRPALARRKRVGAIRFKFSLQTKLAHLLTQRRTTISYYRTISRHTNRPPPKLSPSFYYRLLFLHSFIPSFLRYRSPACCDPFVIYDEQRHHGELLLRAPFFPRTTMMMLDHCFHHQHHQHHCQHPLAIPQRLSHHHHHHHHHHYERTNGDSPPSTAPPHNHIINTSAAARAFLCRNTINP